ncbi:hypothetical protein V5799_009034 [Amblyomma americanum]|uniref:Major facilitator superfamily (MFS) profile domain-containing protein n=1 Tax=Amblyomma americanum TaxID=6943 RepID=A0AAQ4FDC1_AMBAM
MESAQTSRSLFMGGQNTSEAFDCADAFGYGNFQKGMLIFAVLTVWVMHAHTLAFPLISSDLDHWCKRPRDVNISAEAWKSMAIPVEDNGQRSRCTAYASPYDLNGTTVVRCDQWDYDVEVAHTTIVSSWNLVCHRRWLLAVAFAVYMAGSLGFLFVGGFLTDIIGRKLTILGATSVLMLAAFGGCFADTYLMYLSTRFLISGSSCTVCAVAFVLLAEVSTNRHRGLHLSFSEIAGLWLGNACFAVLRGVRLNWIALQLLMVSPTVLLPLSCTLIQESPRWLIARQDLKRAEVVVLAAAKENGFPAQDALDFIERLKSQALDKGTMATGTTEFKNILPATVLRRGLVVFATGFKVMGAFYVVLLTSVAHKKPWMPWASLAVDGAFQALYLALVDRVERVAIAVRVFITAGAICCLLAGMMTGGAPEEYAIALLIVAKALIGVAVIITCLCAAEAFPSNVRGLGFCLFFACGRLGGVFASAASLLRAAGHEDLLLVIAATILFLSALVIERLPLQDNALSQDGTRSSKHTVSSAGVLKEMKATLHPRPKEKVARTRRSVSGKASPNPRVPSSARSVSLQFRPAKSPSIQLG